VEFRPVTTGIRGELDVEIVDGLKEGDEMVIGPFRALRPKAGAQVVWTTLGRRPAGLTTMRRPRSVRSTDLMILEDVARIGWGAGATSCGWP